MIVLLILSMLWNVCWLGWYFFDAREKSPLRRAQARVRLLEGIVLEWELYDALPADSKRVHWKPNELLPGGSREPFMAPPVPGASS